MIEDFGKLGITQDVLKAIEEEKFKQPTSIQNKSIPSVMSGENVIIKASTGSGKTLIYTVKLIKDTQRGAGLQGLVIVPTRELVIQVGKVLNKFSKHKPLNITTSYGGASLKDQKNNFADIDILIATPGRIKQLINEEILVFPHLKTLILDEVDSMFIGQFEDDMKYILKNTPHKKQMLVFSATISKEIFMKIKHYIKNPKRIEANLQVNPKKLRQIFYNIEPNQKLSLLSHLLKTEKAGLIIIFVNRQDTAMFLMNNLKDTNLDIRVTHGDMSAGKRNRIIKDFNNQKFDVLIATDMMARGIDLESVSHIYNYNIPAYTEKYIHRIGRTARAGNTGKVINFVSQKETTNFLEILKTYKLSMQRKIVPKFKEIEIKKKLIKKQYKTKF